MPLVLAVLSVACGVLAVASASASHAAAPDVQPIVRPATPVLSPRRLPEVFGAIVGQAKLTGALDAALDDPAYRSAKACLTVEAGDSLVYSRNPDLTLLPASTMKVLTGMAALRRLGADFHYETPFVAGAAPVNGVIEGPAWLVGSGDPLLSTAAYAASFRNQPQVFTSLDALADAVVAAGVHEIRGGIQGDEGLFDTQRYVPSWKPVYLSDNDVGPSSALSVNDGFVSFKPEPRHHAPAPATHAAATLTALLQGRGVIVGPAGEGHAPEHAVTIAKASSPPLPEIIGEMLRESDNMTAELLVKELGKRFGRDGSWSTGLSVIRDTLADAGLPVEAYRAVDGSGLDVSDRVSCTLLMDTLDLAGPNSAVAEGFPVAGESGTLAERFKNNPAAGKLRAKTGSLNYVAGLTGFVQSAGAGTLEFALLANDLPDKTASGHALQERVGAVLSTYPDVPAADALAPLRPTEGTGG